MIAFFAILATASAATFGGAHDILGNYYDGTTGQISSSLTGHVYNTRPTWASPILAGPVVAAHAPVVAHAPLVAAHAPLVATAHAPLVAAHAPLFAPGYAHTYSHYNTIIGKK